MIHKATNITYILGNVLIVGNFLENDTKGQRKVDEYSKLYALHAQCTNQDCAMRAAKLQISMCN